MPCANPDEICGFCVDFTRRDAEPQYTALGMGRCHGYDNGETSPVRYVAWSESCVLFDKDKANVHARRQFVNKCRAEGVSE
ncbi:MAG: hypothetical protein ACXVG9_12705 [Terriglobales bacterium]